MTNSRQYGLPKKLNIKETAKGREGNATDLRKEPHHFLTSISVPFFLLDKHRYMTMCMTLSSIN